MNDSSREQQTWAVIGASGFVGSALYAALEAAGIPVRAVPAPRLRAAARDAEGILAEAKDLPAERDALAHSLVGAAVVINAAGAATPSGADSPELRGANALLPVLAADAAEAAGASRFIHLSSAAVQGHRPFLDESADVEPFSAYSRSKALGEQALAARQASGCSVVTVRATSVQGTGRPTTQKLARIAASPLASVAGRGDAPTPVSSVEALSRFVLNAGRHQGDVPPLVLQPWEGATVAGVLLAAGGKAPLQLPSWLCRGVLGAGYAVSRLTGERLHGPLRRVELMWFGQRQEPGWAEASGNVPVPQVEQVLRAVRSQRG